MSSRRPPRYLFQYSIGVKQYELKWVLRRKKLEDTLPNLMKPSQVNQCRTFANDKREMLADNIINMCVQKAEQYDLVSFGSIW